MFIGSRHCLRISSPVKRENVSRSALEETCRRGGNRIGVLAFGVQRSAFSGAACSQDIGNTYGSSWRSGKSLLGLCQWSWLQTPGLIEESIGGLLHGAG
jgi:hypothetical protein